MTRNSYINKEMKGRHIIVDDIKFNESYKADRVGGSKIV